MDDRLRFTEALHVKQKSRRDGIRLRGRIHIEKFERGRHVWTRDIDNLVVTTGLDPVAHLLGGDTSRPFQIAAIGYGSSPNPPTIGDTRLGLPAYYQQLTGVTFPSSAHVAFGWAIDGAVDTAAIGLNVQEIGLIVYEAPVALPAFIDDPPPAWQAAHTYIGAQSITDSNGNTQIVTTPGTSGGSTPAWASTLGGVTADGGGGGVQWSCIPRTVPYGGLLFSRANIGLGVISPSVAFASTWTIIPETE